VAARDGDLPSPAQRRVLDAALVAIAEHGLVPSVQASRLTLAAAPEALQVRWRPGYLDAARSFSAPPRQLAGCSTTCSGARPGGDLESGARTVLEELVVARRAIPGYGHPLHKGYDPRSRRLFEVAAESGLAGRHAEAAQVVERLLPEITGKALAMNVSGAIPAVLLDAGYPLLALKGAPLLARTASLIAHLLEEQQRPIGFVLSHAAASAIDYDGKAPDGFVRSDQ
jgi:citrate synthase